MIGPGKVLTWVCLKVTVPIVGEAFYIQVWSFQDELAVNDETSFNTDCGRNITVPAEGKGVTLSLQHPIGPWRNMPVGFVERNSSITGRELLVQWLWMHFERMIGVDLNTPNLISINAEMVFETWDLLSISELCMSMIES